MPPLHKLERLARIRRIHKHHEHRTQLLEIHRLRYVAVKPRLDALLVHIAQHVRGQRNDRQMRMF